MIPGGRRNMKRYAGKGLAWTLAAALFLGGLQGTGIQAAAKPKLNRTKVTLSVGKSVTLKVKRAKKKVKWSTSNKKIAKVTAKGKVRAVAPGTAKITAKTGRVKLVCKVTVKSKAEPGTPGTAPTASATAPSAKPGATSPAAGVSARPSQTNAPKQSASPSQTNAPQQSISPTQTGTPQQSASPSQTDAPQQSTPPSQTDAPQQSTPPSNRPADGQSSRVLPSAGKSRTLTVGTMAVTMGMSMDQVHASVVNSLVRTDQNQLGMQVEVYNPGGDYQNYMLVGYADGKVALMMTISAYFSYEGILFGGDSYSKLESGDWAASKVYYKTNSDGSTQKASGSAAYEYQGSDDHVIAFMDAFGGGTTYGAMVLDNAYTLKDINEDSKGDYEDAQVIYSMEKEIYDLAMAFRVQKNVTNRKAILSENTEANLAAAQYCKDLLSGETDEDSANSYFKEHVGVMTSLGSMNAEKTADAMGTLQYWIGYAACRDILLSVPSGQNPRSYQYVGIGASYDEHEGVAAVLYLFTK